MHPLQTQFITQIELLAQKTHCVLWVMDSTYSHSLFISSSYQSIWGRKQTDLYKDILSWNNFLHEPRANKTWEQLKARNTIINPNHTDTYCIKLPNNKIQWIQDRSFHLNDTNGECILIAGVAMPIKETDVSGKNQIIISDKIDQIRLEFYHLLSLPMQITPQKISARLLKQLTHQQKDILRLIFLGLTAKEIAKKCNLSFRTIESHTENIKKIFKLQTKSELISLAIKQNWISINLS